MAVFYTPRFSYTVSETVICTCLSGPVHRLRDTEYSGTGTGVQAGYGTRVGRGRGIPGTQLAARGEVSDSEAGPVRPCIGPGVGGH